MRDVELGVTSAAVIARLYRQRPARPGTPLGASPQPSRTDRDPVTRSTHDERSLTLAAATLIATGALAGPALAHHQHYIETPQGRWITLPCEPDGTAAADHHPLHERLHVGPAQAIRAVRVAAYGSDTCGSPRPSGPTIVLP